MTISHCDRVEITVGKEENAGYGYEILWVDRSHQGGVQCT